jgi:hypothetical protein
VQAYQHRINNIGLRAPASLVAPIRLGAADDNLVESTAVTPTPAIGYILGGLVGAYVVGAGVGYVASGHVRGAVTGGIAFTGVSAAISAVTGLASGSSKMLGMGYAVVGLGAMAFAWSRKP